MGEIKPINDLNKYTSKAVIEGSRQIEESLDGTEELMRKYKELKEVDEKVEALDEAIPDAHLTVREGVQRYQIDVNKLKTFEDVRELIGALNIIFTNPTDSLKKFMKDST